MPHFRGRDASHAFLGSGGTQGGGWMPESLSGLPCDVTKVSGPPSLGLE
jgi:hypothetical protein